MSARVVVVANTAGGSAKTTVAHALAVATVEYGKRQCSLIVIQKLLSLFEWDAKAQGLPWQTF